MKLQPVRAKASAASLSSSTGSERAPLASRAEATVDRFELDPKLTGKAFRTAMDRQLAQALKRNDGRGGVTLRVSQGGEVAYEAAAGHTDASRRRRMTVHTPFDIASITKTFTAVMILRRVEAGRLRLDSRLSELLPEALIKGFDPKITVKQLLGHTSGLPNYWTDPPHDEDGNNAFSRAFLRDPDRRWLPTELLAHARKLKSPVGKPGRKFHYSDTNYVLLGLILERLDKVPFEKQVRRELLEPLKLRATSFSHDPAKALRPDAGQAHRYEGKEDLLGLERQSADWAGGGMVSTAQDLETFFLALRAGALFESPKTLKTMLARDSKTSDDGVDYGLGVFKVELGKKEGSLWGHDGHGNAFAYYWPEKDLLFTGTLNQTQNDWWPVVEKAISLLS